MYIEIIGVIAILMALRAVITKDRAEKLLYINVIGFCISAIVALYIKTPFGLVLAAAFFISSTIGSNAIAYTLKELEDEITFDKEMDLSEEN
ncbi:DUF2109 domain-containing protein [uncultured Methanobrevibacter sp.]|uniref:DUF2109 domain-containing protein n=1 Tax=uncultured Methanobrevibacter sp. TaxID=253161 RepID=UPI00262482DD